MKLLRSLRIPAAAAVALTVALSGCASTGGSSDDDSSGSSRNLITYEQLQRMPEATALQTIQRLKPIWFRSRGTGSFGSSEELTVVVDGSVRGGVSVLESYQANDLELIRYLDPRMASMRYGTRARGPVIELETRGG